MPLSKTMYKSELRVCKESHGNMTLFTIRNIFYKDGKSYSYSDKIQAIFQYSSYESLEVSVLNYAEALSKPIIDLDNFLNEVYEYK